MALEGLTDKLLSQSPLISYGKLGFWGRRNFWRDQLNLSGRTIVVTGATSGIGKAAALEMAKIGAKLILVGRNQKKLETVKQIIACIIIHNVMISQPLSNNAMVEPISGDGNAYNKYSEYEKSNIDMDTNDLFNAINIMREQVLAIFLAHFNQS